MIGFRSAAETERYFEKYYKYVEDLKRRANAEACPPLADWAKKLFWDGVYLKNTILVVDDEKNDS